MISKVSGFFHMTANFPDDIKTVRILLDAANFGKPISVSRGEGIQQKIAQNTGIFGSNTPFSYISALLVHFMAFLVHF